MRTCWRRCASAVAPGGRDRQISRPRDALECLLGGDEPEGLLGDVVHVEGCQLGRARPRIVEERLEDPPQPDDLARDAVAPVPALGPILQPAAAEELEVQETEDGA
jgi:hypothetical protein